MPTAQQLYAAINQYNKHPSFFSPSYISIQTAVIRQQVNDYLMPFLKENQPLSDDVIPQLTFFFKPALEESLKKDRFNEFGSSDNCVGSLAKSS